MNRRAYLAGLATSLVGIAGCRQRGGGSGVGESGPPPTATLEMVPVTDAEITRRFVDPVEDGPEGRLVEHMATNGTATIDGADPPFRNNSQLTHNGTIYRVSFTSSDPQMAYRYHVLIDHVEGDVSENETVTYADLPAVDQKMQLEAQHIGVGTQFTYFPAERNQSMLVPTPEKSIVTWESGERARFSVRESEKITARETYHYTAERIDNTEAYGAEVRREHEFELSGLSDAEQEIVQQAMSEDGYRVAPQREEPEATPTAAIERLVERFRRHRENGFEAHAGKPSPGTDGRYLVQYDGQTYWTVLGIDEDEF